MKKPKVVHCFWCGQDIEVHKGRLRLHWKCMGKQQCVGSGQPADKVEAHNKMTGQAAKAAEIQRKFTSRGKGKRS